MRHRVHGLAIVVAIVLAAHAASLAAQQDSTYATPRLRALVAEAAAANRRPPDSLAGYQGRIESELVIGFRDTLGVDRTTQIEDVALRARWHRSGIYELRVLGHRTQVAGPTFSVVSMLRGWTTPVLYGDRLRLGLVADTMRSRRQVLSRRRQMADSRVVAVHPFAADRDSFYRFTGGDTVTVLRSRWRRIPIVRVHVRPAARAPAQAMLFEGDVDLDAERSQVVRMRGKLVRVDPRRDLGGVTGSGRILSGVGYLEFENAEVDGRFWLPVYQRTEMQGYFTPLGDVRSVFRIVSRFRDIEPNAPAVLAMVPRADSTAPDRYVLSRARADSIEAYREWQLAIGEANAGVSAEDFADLAPEAWSQRGKPIVEMRARQLSEFGHFNRVEGLYTGLGAQVRMRDRAPGVTLRATGGWAWAEGTARGAVSAEWRKGNRIWTARAQRELAGTNDLTAGPAEGTSLGALFSSLDNQDWLDRRSATMSALTGAFRGTGMRLGLEAGLVRDAPVRSHLRRGLFGSDTGFRPVRGIDPGTYGRTVVTVELNPRVSAFLLDEGFGAAVRWERGQGDLNYDRYDASAAFRRLVGPLTLVSRLSGAMVTRHIPPQQLVELGSQEGLSAYGYRQFTGDRGALGRSVANYAFRYLRSPRRWLGSRLPILPGIAPGVSAGIQAGWTELSGTDPRASAARLLAPVPLAPFMATGGIRASVDARITFFGGALGVGVARPIDGFHDRPSGWRLVFSAGQGL